LPIHKNSLFDYLDEGGRLEKNSHFLNNMTTLETTIKNSHDWAIDRIHDLSIYDIEAAHAIQSEFNEWLNPDIEEHDIFSLEYIGE
jgi:hypothetical protein